MLKKRSLKCVGNVILTLESKITQYYCKEKKERFDLVLNTRLVPFLYVISSNFSFPEKKRKKR